jgi:aminopeptidase N
MMAVLTVASSFFLSAAAKTSRHAHASVAAWTPPEPVPNDAKYAPNRMVDIQHLALDITPDFEKQTIKGKAVLSFKPIGKPLNEIRLDAVDLAVSELVSTAPISGYDVTDKEIVVSFATPVAVGSNTTITVTYSAKPLYGFYFRGPASGFSAEDEHAFSQGEMIESRHWFPCYDHPNSKFTSEITCHIPDGMMMISNGKEISQKKDADGNVAVRWSQDKPHVNYLITLLVGKFSKLEDSYRGIPLVFYSLPSDRKQAAAAFSPTKAAMEFFENETGVEYPWSQYGQAVVHDYHYGGMENTTITTLWEPVLYTPESENIHVNGGIFDPEGNFNSEVLVSHELAHQWFGDLVTCKDWSHAWLNEGFATYYSLLFAQHKNGRDDMMYGLMQDMDKILAWTDERPIVYRRFKEPVEQFSFNRAYSKASWVVHMLRSELGDDLFRRCVKTYLERFQYKTVTTEDLNNVVEELSGRSFDQFFDQWVYHSTVPELQIDYEWDEHEKLAKISVSQQQKTGDRREKMQFPLTLRFKTKKGVVERRVDVKELDEDFYVPLDQAPDIVRIDPDLVLLAKITFRARTQMLYAQLVDKDDTVGRMLAADQLSDKQDETTIAKLKDSLNTDKFFGVRVKASNALRKIHSDEALEALIASIKQSDARARWAVIADIGKFFNQRARDVLIRHLDTEKNPAIISIALSGLSAYRTPQVHEILVKNLNGTSYQNRIETASIRAMQEQADVSYIAVIKETLLKRESEFQPQTITAGLDAIASLAKDERQKDDVRLFLAGFLNHKRVRTQCGAILALGTLEDPAAIPLLEKFASSSKSTPQQADAERAISILRKWNKPGDNLKDLRTQVLDLEKSHRELKKELEDLKKRLKATDGNKPRIEAAKGDSSKSASKPASKPAPNKPKHDVKAKSK